MKRIVVVSDLHLGDERGSLREKSITSSFVEEIKDVKTIILLGDIFDLSMASLSESVKCARVFFEELKNLELDEIVYLPGNHDHHLLVLETEYKDIIQTMLNGGIPKLPDYIREFRGKESFISGILPDSLKDKLVVKYPNHKIKIENKTYLFHHGHYLSREGSLLAKTSEAIKKGISLNEF
ncbi:MAG: metallophosphoesterase, partial [bacterium]